MLWWEWFVFFVLCGCLVCGCVCVVVFLGGVVFVWVCVWVVWGWGGVVFDCWWVRGVLCLGVVLLGWCCVEWCCVRVVVC